MWAWGFLVFICLCFFSHLQYWTVLLLSPQKRWQRQASEKDFMLKILAIWRPVDTIPLKSALQNTMAVFYRSPPMVSKAWRKAVQSRQHQENPTAVEKLLLYITSLLNLSWGKFYNKSWLCATLPGSCGVDTEVGAGDGSVTPVLEHCKLGCSEAQLGSSPCCSPTASRTVNLTIPVHLYQAQTTNVCLSKVKYSCNKSEKKTMFRALD